MTFDAATYLAAVDRSVSSLARAGKPARAVTLARGYATTMDDLWDALTNPERLPRWFLPVAGDFRQGGHYQLEGNAAGAIEVCEPPTRLHLTWVFGGSTSWVEVRLGPGGPGGARLELSHIAHADASWEEYGPGAGGVGWDLALAGLAMSLGNPAARLDGEEFAASPAGLLFIKACADAWARADIASGTDAAQARAAGRRTSAFYTGSPSPES